MQYRPKIIKGTVKGTGWPIDGHTLYFSQWDYARVYHTSTSDLEKKRVTDFIVEYAEAAEDLAEERKRMEKNRPHFKPKHVRKRR